MSNASWMQEPEDHDYTAAAAYLSLVMADADAQEVVTRLREAPVTTAKAKDLLRASRLPELGDTNRHVRKDIKRIESGEQLSPLLAVRGDARTGAPLTIADGYHRMCAAYLADEDTVVWLKVVDLT